MSEFVRDLKNVANRHSQENASNTPDFILAQFLEACLAAWNTAVQQREGWYGRDPRPTCGACDDTGQTNQPGDPA